MAGVPDNEADLSAEAAPTALLRGDVDLATAPSLLRELLGAVARPVASVTVDLGYVTFLDSSGVGALNTAREAAEDNGVVFTLDAIPINVRRVLEVTGMVSVFHVADHRARLMDGFD